MKEEKKKMLRTLKKLSYVYLFIAISLMGAILVPGTTQDYKDGLFVLVGGIGLVFAYIMLNYAVHYSLRHENKDGLANKWMMIVNIWILGFLGGFLGFTKGGDHYCMLVLYVAFMLGVGIAFIPAKTLNS